MDFDQSISKFVEVIKSKTVDGVQKLETVDIGTKEYEVLVQHIVSNINLINQQGQQPNGHQKTDFTNVIGKDFS